MSELRSVLRRYTVGSPRLGSRPFPAEALRKDLGVLVRNNSQYFRVTFGLLVVLLLLVAFLLAKFLNEPAKAGAVLAVSGISIPYLLRTMLRMWETKTNTEVLIQLATALDGETLHSIVKVLSEPVVKNRSW
jgi:hypothetical protein